MHFWLRCAGIQFRELFRPPFLQQTLGKETWTDMRRMLLLLSVFKELMLGIGTSIFL